MTEQNDKPAKRRSLPDSYGILRKLQLLACAGCILILVYAMAFGTNFWRIAGVGILVAGAALVAGFLLGFIFAIPRDGSEAGSAKDGSDSKSNKNGDDKRPVRPNSNLVEISDWLTKIIVGVGLVELKTSPKWMGKVSYYLGQGLTPENCNQNPCGVNGFTFSGQTAGLAILVLFSSIGFLLGYVWTRLYFARDLERQIRELEEQVEALEQEKEELKQQKQQLQSDKVSLENDKLDLQKQKTELQKDKEKLEQDKADLEKYRLILVVQGLADDGQLDEAMKYIDKAIQGDPQDGRLILTKARILKRKALQDGVSDDDRRQLLNEAIDDSNRAIVLLPGKPEAIYNKACYLAQLNPIENKRQILAALEQAFQMNPGLKTVAASDSDLESMRQFDEFRALIGDAGNNGG